MWSTYFASSPKSSQRTIRRTAATGAWPATRAASGKSRHCAGERRHDAPLRVQARSVGSRASLKFHPARLDRPRRRSRALRRDAFPLLDGAHQPRTSPIREAGLARMTPSRFSLACDAAKSAFTIISPGRTCTRMSPRWLGGRTTGVFRTASGILW